MKALPPSPSPPWSYGAEQKARLLFLSSDADSNSDLDKVDQREKFIWVINWFYAEWQNGGTDQVFYNFTGDHLPLAIEAFESIGANSSAATLRQACKLFPNGEPSKLQVIRREQMAEILKKDADVFAQFDGNWFQEDVFGLLLKYWKNHEPPLEKVPEPRRRKSEALRLFVELPVVSEGDYNRPSDRERCLWDICFFAALADSRGKAADFLVSPEGDQAVKLVTELEKIGALQTAAIVRQICSYYPNGWPSSAQAERLSQSLAIMDKTRAPLGGVEIRNGIVKKGGHEEDLYALVLEYWKRYAEP